MELKSKNNFWGIIDNNREIVPAIYKNPKDAIFEWEWFEIENFNREFHRKFLSDNKNLNEINKIKEILIKSIKQK